MSSVYFGIFARLPRRKRTGLALAFGQAVRLSGPSGSQRA